MGPPTVTAIQCGTAVIPLPAALTVGDAIVSSREYTAVFVSTSDGFIGKAYCLSRNAPVTQIVSEMIGPHVLGQPADEPTQLWERMLRRTAIVGRVGLVRRCLGLLDIALWDIKTQRDQMPLHQALGAGRSARPAMLVASYPTPGRNADEIAEEILHHAQDGWPYLKLARSSDNALMRNVLQTVCAQLPVSAQLVVDASFAWPTVDAALHDLGEWQCPPLAWLEDPLLPEDVAGCAQLRAGSGLRIGVGDEVTDPRLIDSLVAADALDVVRLDVVALGGITPTVELMHQLQGTPVHFSSHVYPEVAVHLGCDIETFARDPGGNPYDPAPTLIRGGPTFTRGYASPPTVPGLGFDLDPASFRLSPILRVP